MKIRAHVEVVLLSLLFLLPPQWISADDEAGKELPSQSPDGKFLIRTPNEAERKTLGENDVPKPGLFDVKSGRHVACLPLDSMEGFVDSLRVVWSEDSTRVAFNFRAGGRYFTTVLCELKAGESINLPSPESLLLDVLTEEKDATIKGMGLAPDVYKRRILDAVTTQRWIDENTIEVDGHSIITVPVKSEMKDAEADTEIVEAKSRFTLKWDASKEEWKIIQSKTLTEE